MASDMTKPWLQARHPTEDDAHRVLWFQDAHGHRLPVAVTPTDHGIVLQIGANPTMALTLSRRGGEQLGLALMELTGGWRHVDQAAPDVVAANNAAGEDSEPALDLIGQDIAGHGNVWIDEDLDGDNDEAIHERG